MDHDLPRRLALITLTQSPVLLPGLLVRLHVHGPDTDLLLKEARRQVDASTQALFGLVPVKAGSSLEQLVNGGFGKQPDRSDKSPDASPKSLVKRDDSALCKFGCAAKVRRIERAADGGTLILVEGLSRFAIDQLVQTQPYYEAEVTHLVEKPLLESDKTVHKLLAELKQTSLQYLAQLDASMTQENMIIRQMEDYVAQVDLADAGHLADLIISTSDATFEDRKAILESIDVKTRTAKAIVILEKQISKLKLRKKINIDLSKKLSKTQREYILRQQLKAIREELGEKGNSENDKDEIKELTDRLEAASLPEDALKIARRELMRLKLIPALQAEYGVIRTYLETLADIPWSIKTDDCLNAQTLQYARQQLDRNHYGLNKVKKRIIEYLAVLRLKHQAADIIADKGPILLFVGPPGTGKTSLGKSISSALGRKFYRLSVGGVRDEAEIRGHRRTYVGAMPGLIVQGLRKVGVNNPVFLLDEIDKISGNNFHGDPSAAMLEVLDPEQNHAFNDHYINTPVDLSKVLFIATANHVETIAPPLLDRMETISLPGYTIIEKLHIARRHLLPKQLRANGLTDNLIIISDEVITKIATCYTREPGVRNLEREIAGVCRFKAVEMGELKDRQEEYKYVSRITIDNLEDILGVQKFDSEIVERSTRPGVVTGLAYAGAGNGSLLFIEASVMPGKGVLHLTGKLGDVIKESAQIALSWVKSHAFVLGLTTDLKESVLKDRDVHIHCPAGAIAKDGPSAGMAMTLALISLFSQQKVAPLIAMTGEITLRGNILPVGGIKEKVLAAHRADIKCIILPSRNKKDVVHDLPKNVQQDIQFLYARTMWDVLNEVWPEYLQGKADLNTQSRL